MRGIVDMNLSCSRARRPACLRVWTDISKPVSIPRLLPRTRCSINESQSILSVKHILAVSDKSGQISNRHYERATVRRPLALCVAVRVNNLSCPIAHSCLALEQQLHHDALGCELGPDVRSANEQSDFIDGNIWYMYQNQAQYPPDIIFWSSFCPQTRRNRCPNHHP